MNTADFDSMFDVHDLEANSILEGDDGLTIKFSNYAAVLSDGALTAQDITREFKNTTLTREDGTEHVITEDNIEFVVSTDLDRMEARDIVESDTTINTTKAGNTHKRRPETAIYSFTERGQRLAEQALQL